LEQLSILLRIEKMSVIDQTALIQFMETGILSETKVKKTRELKLVSWVFGYLQVPIALRE